MAELPDELAVPSPPFSHVGLDLAGPFLVKKQGGGRDTRRNIGTFKTWVLLILCLQTKAVKLYLACGYSTEEFLLAYEQFVSDHGTPISVHSDRGSQIVSAAGEIDGSDSSVGN